MSKITNITICKLPYQKHPFVHGERDGKDVWLTQSGEWTEIEGDPSTAIPFHQQNIMYPSIRGKYPQQQRYYGSEPLDIKIKKHE